MITQINM